MRIQARFPDPAYYFECGSGSWFLFDADPDPNFDMMRMRIHATKMMRIHADPDPQHWLQLYTNVPELPTHPVWEPGSLGGLREGKTSTKQEHDAPRESKQGRE